MNQYKIVFAGPVGAGKTTAINTISDIPTINTDEIATDFVSQKKVSTTVGMDYGLIKLPDGGLLHLYGTPGQERFDFMWDILVSSGDGLVLLLDNTSPSPLEDMDFYLEALQKHIAPTRLTIGVTQMDLSTEPTLADYRKHAQKLGFSVKVFAVDARVKHDVNLLIYDLLHNLKPRAPLIDHAAPNPETPHV
jgi:signal recognition particle receptor subunit beta